MITVHHSKLYQVYRDDPDLVDILIHYGDIYKLYEKYLSKGKIDNIYQLINDFHEEDSFSYEKELIFHLSIKHEYKTIIDLLLSLGFDIYQLNKIPDEKRFRVSYLSTALMKSSIDFIAYLIEKGYDINHCLKDDGIMNTLSRRSVEELQYLFSLLDINQLSLDDIVIFIVNTHNSQQISLILEISPWSLEDISEAINNNMSGIVDLCNPFSLDVYDACGLMIDYQKMINNTHCTWNVNIIEHILKKGIYPSSDHLYKMIRYGGIRMLSLLVKYGADLSVVQFDEEDEKKCDKLIDYLITSFSITDRHLMKIFLMTNPENLDLVPKLD